MAATSTTKYSNSVKLATNSGAAVAIGDSVPDTYVTDAIVDIAGTGALLIPRLTTTQRDALTATTGMVIYNTTTNKLNFYAAAAWEAVTSA